MKLLVFPLFFLFGSAFAVNMIKNEEFVKNYFNEIKKTYDKRVAPMGEKGPGSAINVSVSMWIMDISKIDDSNMEYTAQFYIRQKWNDSRLRFSSENESDAIVLGNVDEIWSPDLFFTGGRGGKQHQLIHPNAFLRIMPNGEVFYSVRVTVTFPCTMDLRSFPHDTQECQMRIESYAHSKKDIDLEWISDKPLGYDENITLFNFGVTGCNTSSETVHFSSGVYKVLKVDLNFERKFGFFAIKLYVPFTILVIVSLLSLWIRAEEKGLRFSLLVIILYLMIHISSEVSNDIPPAPYTKGTDVWIGFSESLVFAIFLEFIAVALISGRHDNEVLESKGEMLLNMEADAKEQPLKTDSLKSHLCKFVNMFDARNAGKEKRDASAHRVDKICRIVFPLIFLLFNIVYWSVYCCK